MSDFDWDAMAFAGVGDLSSWWGSPGSRVAHGPSSAVHVIEVVSAGSPELPLRRLTDRLGTPVEQHGPGRFRWSVTTGETPGADGAEDASVGMGGDERVEVFVAFDPIDAATRIRIVVAAPELPGVPSGALDATAAAVRFGPLTADLTIAVGVELSAELMALPDAAGGREVLLSTFSSHRYLQVLLVGGLLLLAPFALFTGGWQPLVTIVAVTAGAFALRRRQRGG